MEPIKWKVENVIDSHTHFPGIEGIEHLLKIMELVNVSRFNVLVGPSVRTAKVMDFVMSNKAKYPERFYCFAGIKHNIGKAQMTDADNLAAQVGAAYEAGFDGMKMLEGKPATRRCVAPFALDSDYYRPYWEQVLAYDMPVTLHVADPATFWRADTDINYSRDLADKEEFYREIYAVLERHPTLRISLAHFFFMAGDLDRAADLFDRFPNIKFDTAPNADLMYYLSEDPQKSHDFLVKYSDRVMYGTDTNDRNSLVLAYAKAESLRRLFETDLSYIPLQKAEMERPTPGPNGLMELRGLSLPIDVLTKICRTNFEGFASKMPKPIPVLQA